MKCIEQLLKQAGVYSHTLGESLKQAENNGSRNESLGGLHERLERLLNPQRQTVETWKSFGLSWYREVDTFRVAPWAQLGELTLASLPSLIFPQDY